MVILPYKDRLALMSKYLQQLVMESLGKQHDLHGAVVNQGIAVYGNKGSTDQHAYVQQLRDGVNNFFATFIEVREASAAPPLEVEPGVTPGDYLQGFLRGTRSALHDNGRESVTLSIPRVDAFHLGALIALYEPGQHQRLPPARRRGRQKGRRRFSRLVGQGPRRADGRAPVRRTDRRRAQHRPRRRLALPDPPRGQPPGSRRHHRRRTG
jgi:hypothetical protein